MNRAAVEAYAAGGPKLTQAIMGISGDDFLAYPVPGTWSLGEIVVHLMDSDLIASDRMKRVIAENHPQLIGYDETAFAKNLSYGKQDPQVAAEIFRLNRQLTSVVLRNVPDEAFARTGQHSERGSMTLAQLVDTYVAHLEHHLGFIHRKRELLGKPLPASGR